MDAASCIKAHEGLRTARNLEEPQLRQLAEYCRPDQVGAWTRGRKSRTGHEDLFDATHLQALEAFAGGLYSQLTSDAMRWFELGLSDRELGEFQPVKLWLRQSADVIYRTLSVAASRFYAEMPGFYMDLGAYGYATLYSEHLGFGRFLDRTIPCPEIFFSTDADGSVNRVHREFRLKGAQLKRKFREGADARDDSEYVVLHCVYENPEARPDSPFARHMPFASVYCSPDLKGFEKRGGYNELPYHITQWMKAPGRAYPTGPGHVAIADIKMLNEMERVDLTAAQHAAEPMLLANDEGTFSIADIRPRNVLYGTVNEAGKPLVVPLSMGGDTGRLKEKAAQRREAIKEAFFFGLMQLMNRPQMTATEFLGFQQEKLRLIAPNLARVQADGLTPFIARRYRELDRLGALPEPPPMLPDGAALEVSYVSPLAKVMQAAEGQSTLQWLGAAATVAQFDPSVMDKVDGDATLDVLHTAFGPPPKVLRDPRAVEKIRQGRAAAQAQQTELNQAQQATAIAAEQAHAEQAMTLAGKRQVA
jgi:hypothetical protein